jgi:Protein of unknown function (DUF3099)
VPRSRPGEPEVYQITDAASAHSSDLEARMTRYLLSMLIRTICVVLVLVVDGPLRWVFAVGAVGLPYVAVVMANNSGRRRGSPSGLGTPASQVRQVAAGAVREPLIQSPEPAPEGLAEAAGERLVGGLREGSSKAPEPLRDSA